MLTAHESYEHFLSVVQKPELLIEQPDTSIVSMPKEKVMVVIKACSLGTLRVSGAVCGPTMHHRTHVPAPNLLT